MAKQENGYRANIGSSSLILIFIVMCLVTFGMLSLSAAKSDLNLAERNAAAVTEYYRADSEGEKFCAMVREAVKEACLTTDEEAGRRQLLLTALGQYYQEDEETVSTDIAMERAQALRVLLSVDLEGAGSVAVSQWKVIQTEDYEIDQSMPVWTGSLTS